MCGRAPLRGTPGILDRPPRRRRSRVWVFPANLRDCTLIAYAGDDRTAASAFPREGCGSTGAGAARTWSDKPCFGHILTLVIFASMTGLSVRPAPTVPVCHRVGRVS